MKNDVLNIIFWGEDAFSNVVLDSLIRSRHTIKMVITPFYDNLVYKKIEYTCIKNNIPLLRTKKINSKEVYDTVKKINPDLCVISHFERLIKEPILSIPRLGFINLHPSLLPYYRGMGPQHWPIINGEKETGITVHYVDEGADTGDIILQYKFLLLPDMYVSDLQKIWIGHYRTIIIEAIDNILSNKPTIRQKDLQGSYYGKLRKEDCIIRDSMTVKDAYNLIRGVSLPYGGALYKDLIIYKAHPMAEDEIINNKTITIHLSNGYLILDKYKLKQ